MQIKITENKLDQKLSEYQNRNGSTKKWIAEQLGMSQQRLYQLCLSSNMMVDVALKFAEFLNCDVKDLFEYEVIK